jgi:maleate isomerase
MRVPGVTTHMGRIHITDADLSSNTSFESLLDQVRREIDAATARVLTCEPDAMVMGMSAETFWGGIDGNRQFTEHMRAISGMDVTMGANACIKALELYGVRRVGVVTPYQPLGDEQVVRYFTECGYEVLGVEGLKCPTAPAISQVPESRLRQAIVDLHRQDVEAVVQVGTNLSMVGLADEAQRWLDIPVVAINAATWWAALRENGIEDRIEGAGDLLANH